MSGKVRSRYNCSIIAEGMCVWVLLFCSQMHSPWLRDIVDSGIGLSYRPASLCSLAGLYDFISPVRDYEFGHRYLILSTSIEEQCKCQTVPGASYKFYYTFCAYEYYLAHVFFIIVLRRWVSHCLAQLCNGTYSQLLTHPEVSMMFYLILLQGERFKVILYGKKYGYRVRG